ncbi:MBL fold metallo-hydrolase [Heliobacterium gestii]|uniref:beta-lactamase n=1 Tax=Heliomicrobium gestii TaxID=2699 RepID=A0A845LM75_HELGE|nr:MBL fold metallo-hydrolase [Heliomicrobium gestii]MBM7867475.1 glyoxylase-like metal-dependent hydrolase (beta-lactamase superfamily II) [Heliomicrobium gestii]MZP43976.1 MBL fold metallo-hydrolase [Heliomicrobium gestii]
MKFLPLGHSAAVETWYLPGRVNIGAIVCDGEAVIVDTGLEAQAGKRVCRLAKEAGWRIVAIINTHTHADHIGGNSAIVEQFGCPVYAPDLERDFVKHPIFMAYFLIGGVAPWREMNNKFLVAPASAVAAGLLPGPFPWPGRADAPELTLIDLSGHTGGQIGVACGDVLYAGDAFIGPDVLQLHGIPFNVDIDLYRASLSRIAQSTYVTVLPCHGVPLERPALEEVLGINEQQVMALVDDVYALLEEPCEVETLVARLCPRVGKEVASVGSYFLYRSSVQAYLTYLHQQGKVETKICHNRLYWQRSGQRMSR